MPRNRFILALAVVLVGLLGAAAVFLLRATVFRPTTISAYFTAASAIYPGDQVRVAGVAVGHITSIRPQTNRVKLEMSVDRGVLIPADVKAVIVSRISLRRATSSSHPPIGPAATSQVVRRCTTAR